ncbi:MAG: two-component system chemotaxis response regulator CheY [Alphaproteobacteria bacterium]|jgi:two-component system chemotaxis response regulator CheY
MTKKILVIDDMKTLRVLLGKVLRSSGYEVVEAVDGIDGLDNFTLHKPDLVISDLNMPNMDGIGFVAGARSKAEGKSVPILILTTETNDALKLRAKEAGATGWLTKPFNPKRLTKLVDQLTGTRRA